MTTTKSAGWIIAGESIDAIGATPEACYAEYIDTTGDDSKTMEQLIDAPEYYMHMRPATARLIAYVEKHGATRDGPRYHYINGIADLDDSE